MSVRTAAALALFALLALALLPAGAVSEGADAVKVSHDPDDVVLEGDRATLAFSVKNQGTEAVKVALQVRTGGSPSTVKVLFRTQFATVQPGKALETELVVKRDDSVKGPLERNLTVSVHWGRQLALDEEDRPVPSTVEGEWNRKFRVTEPPEPDYGPIPFLVLLAAVVVVVVFLMYPAWAQTREDWEGGELSSEGGARDGL